MPQRVFLGWDEPFLKPAISWLLERKAELPGMLIVVPTAQSGRRLRESLAEAAGAILSPKVATPGSLLRSDAPDIAPDWIEQVAWAEVLETITDWTDYEALFPDKPGEGPGWASGLAAEMVRLRASLQENGLTLQSASWPLKETVEGDRWAALARLERLVESKLTSWNLRSRSRALMEGVRLPPVSHIVLAGIAEMPPLVERTLLEWRGTVTVLIGAPQEHEEDFNLMGIPLDGWSRRNFPWPEGDAGSVTVVADPRQQASEALRFVARQGHPSDQIVLGSADAETGEELQRTFSRAGWTAFHPAATAVKGGLPRWFSVWREWLAEPKLSVFADLLALPETGILIGGKRAQKAARLAQLRDRWMILRGDDLQRRLSTEKLKEWETEPYKELLESIKKLEALRYSILGRDFITALQRLLEMLGRTGPAAREASFSMLAWLDDAASWIVDLGRSPSSWIDLMVSGYAPPPPAPPPGRVIDVQGWLELYHEAGAHLVLCGMNEGKVPARGGGEPWLSEAIRGRLGLITDEDRAARDAWLLYGMVMCRRAHGRVDLICGKAGSGGEALLPSRLLLVAETAALPGRIETLFRDVEPPEAGLRWEADWHWKPREVEPPAKVSVTALRDYLKCPFRYYLKHVVRMQQPDPQRDEWSARDFGNVVHDILERWGRDEEARDFTKTEAIEAYFSAELDRITDDWFGRNVPLSIRIQREAMKQRLAWLARHQACERADGWQVIDVERPVSLAIGGMTITAKIDRIDRHADGRLRVLDYKTGRVAGVDKEHRVKVGAATILPQHLSGSPALFDGIEKDKSVRFLWSNLQLPLYVSALMKSEGQLAIPCYFTLGATEAEVALHQWSDFSIEDLDAAEACAEWIAGNISGGVFWPPAEKVTYDDYAVLGAGKDLVEMILPPGAVS